MQKFSKWNNGCKYLLMIIDIFSKYGWIVPLKNKKSELVIKAFNQIFKENRVLKYLWTDKGKEFYNKNLKDVLDKRNVKWYSTENEDKSSIVERWNKTIKTKMWKRFTEQNSTQYLKMLPDIINKYNNSYHSSIKISPVEASKKKKEGIVYYNLYRNLKATKTKPKFKVGDRVRISIYKQKTFDTGYTPNWTEEIFIISEVLNSNIPIKFVIFREKKLLGAFMNKNF